MSPEVLRLQEHLRRAPPIPDGWCEGCGSKAFKGSDGYSKCCHGEVVDYDPLACPECGTDTEGGLCVACIQRQAEDHQSNLRYLQYQIEQAWETAISQLKDGPVDEMILREMLRIGECETPWLKMISIVFIAKQQGRLMQQGGAR